MGYVCYLPIFNVPTDITYHATNQESIDECVHKTRETSHFYRCGSKAGLFESLTNEWESVYR